MPSQGQASGRVVVPYRLAFRHRGQARRRLVDHRPRIRVLRLRGEELKLLAKVEGKRAEEKKAEEEKKKSEEAKKAEEKKKEEKPD